MNVYRTLTLVIAMLLSSGCDNTDVQLAAEAGMEAVKAATLSDEAVVHLSRQSAEQMDRQHRVAPADSVYARRLQALVNGLPGHEGITFNFQVYLAEQENAFAMADGTIRIYSGLMDLLDDQELRFVLGHEMGHVIKQHSRNKLRLAYAARAVRMGVASQGNLAGDIARSQLGGLVEMLMGAQFSQLEEKVADDYGLQFLQTAGHAPADAVSALGKLASLGQDHSFLASHPEPAARAARIELQIQGKALPLEETHRNFIQSVGEKFTQWYEALKGFFTPAPKRAG